MLKIYVAKAQVELGDLLLDKITWLAVLGVIVALAKSYNWDISLEVFAAIEVLIVAVILALKGTSPSVTEVADALGLTWCD